MNLRRLLVLPVLLSLGGCCLFRGDCPLSTAPIVLLLLENSSGSPTQTGFGAAINAPASVTQAADFYLNAGYMRQFWDGGADNVFSVGGQARRPLDRSAAGSTWIGLEGTYHYWSVSEDDEFESPGLGNGGNPVSNVLGLSGLVGHPLGESGVSLFGSAGLLYFSDFKRDGSVWDEGGMGWMVRTGVEFTGLFGGN